MYASVTLTLCHRNEYIIDTVICANKREQTYQFR